MQANLRREHPSKARPPHIREKTVAAFGIVTILVASCLSLPAEPATAASALLAPPAAVSTPVPIGATTATVIAPQSTPAAAAASLSSGVNAFFSSFGAHEESGGKVSFAFGFGNTPKLRNFLILNGVGTDMRAVLYRKESCGARAYQFLTVENDDKENLEVVYSCAGVCLGLHEASVSNPKASSAEAMPLPVAFCEGLWGGAIKIEDVHGL